MSGIEVVGIVLGAIPLVISGLEHYAEGIEKIRIIRNYSQEFRAVRRKLDAEQVLFRNTLQILLKESVEDSLQTQLLDNLGTKQWTNPQVEYALKERLQGSYASYMAHIESIDRSLAEFKKRLDIGSNGQVPFDSLSSFRQAKKRLGFALKQTAYADLIEEIKADNSTLLKFTEQTRALQGHKRSRYMPDFDRIKAGASGVFESLQRALQISCGIAHNASICLKPPANTGSGPYGSAEETSFRVILHHGPVKAKGPALSWSVEEAELRVLPDNTVQPLQFLPASTAVHSAKQKSVRFMATSSASGPPKSDQDQLQEIQDLCRSLQNMKTMRCGACLGYVMAVSSQCRHGLYWPAERLIERDCGTTGLHALGDLLDRQQTTCKLTNADAHRLAVSLAWGVLHFHKTPWLAQDWRTDITILSRNGKTLSEYPFLTRELVTTVVRGITPSSASRSTASVDDALAASIIRNKVLFHLGLALIELCMEKPMAQLHLPNEVNADSTKKAISDFQTAARLIQMGEISDRFGWRWSEVVRRCIYCDLNHHNPDLDNAEFRRAVYTDIVGELEEDRRAFLGHTQL